MQAITYQRYGPPDVLTLSELPPPVPTRDQILVRVRAVEATKSDCELRSFRHPVSWYWLPMRLALGVRRPRMQVLGRYFAGEIVEVGSAVAQWRTGEVVFGCMDRLFGAYAEYVALSPHAPLARIPRSLSFEAAAAVPLGGLNALHFLKRARLRRGERLLVNGAGGSIGTFGVQLARAYGAVVTTVDAGHKAAMLEGLGVADFIDYRQTDFAATGRRWDVILDMVADSSYGACLAALNPGGRYLKAVPRLLDLARAPLTSRFSDKTVVVAFARETSAALEELATLIEQGDVVPVVDRAFPMTEAAEAHRRVETEARLGCVVLRMSWE